MGNSTRHLFLAIFSLVASGIPAPPAYSLPPGSGKLYYVHNDPAGTPQALTDESGNVVWTAETDPFGGAKVNEDPDGDGQLVTLNIRAPGQYFDQETGLHYNYFRYYDPRTGRYHTPDPIGLDGGLNTYSYAYANPLLYTDPLGLWSLSFDAFYGFGGGISFGQNPDGSAFLTTRFGYGLGGGLSYDPDGTSPGYNCGRNNIDYVGAGFFGGVNAGLGPFFAGVNGSGGARRDRLGSTSSFLNSSFSYGGLLDGRYSLRLGGAIGTEFTFVDSQPINLAGEQDTCNPCRQ